MDHLGLPRKASRLRLSYLALIASIFFFVMLFSSYFFYPSSGGNSMLREEVIPSPTLAPGEIAKVAMGGGILKVSAYYGEGSWLHSGASSSKKKDQYRQSLAIHSKHALLHGHEQYISRHQYFDKEVNNAYSKIANLLQRNLVEMDKGEKGAKWLFWHDADAIIVNKRVSLETFLPPDEETDVNFMFTRDGNGLNAGQLYLRVGEWTSLFLATILAVSKAKDSPILPFWEQSAIRSIVEGDNDYFTKRCFEVPRHWINVYAFETKENYPKYNPKQWVRPGSFLVHLVGDTKHVHGWFDKLLSVGEGDDPTYHSEIEASNLAEEAKEFWTQWKADRKAS